MIFDLIIIGILAWGAFQGFTKGLIMQLATLAALLLGILGAVWLSGYVSPVLTEKFELSGKYLPIISFSICFIVIVIAVNLLGRLIEKFAQVASLGLVNRLIGLVFGVLKYLMLVSILLVVLNSIHAQKPYLPEKQLKDSKLYKPLSELAPAIFPYLKFEIRKPGIPTIPNEIQV